METSREPPPFVSPPSSRTGRRRSSITDNRLARTTEATARDLGIENVSNGEELKREALNRIEGLKAALERGEMGPGKFDAEFSRLWGATRVDDAHAVARADIINQARWNSMHA
eukprot:CAMPEP_0206165132 /NCGR_PEP_ID=MMETSP1474-20131121/19196_1 /ASSEMBLY_ACC=CAM_ASM_001110 /TAXON_ID=97495 /ORGANISM="Imantonia sp., Strain RCC918" /LENGTH=112 /DNA_ID=CAMNT_0053568355 /DNA_START=20 /DNA_END=358 /DNA_ORIENTATION=+